MNQTLASKEASKEITLAASPSLNTSARSKPAGRSSQPQQTLPSDAELVELVWPEMVTQPAQLPAVLRKKLCLFVLRAAEQTGQFTCLDADVGVERWSCPASKWLAVPIQ